MKKLREEISAAVNPAYCLLWENAHEPTPFPRADLTRVCLFCSLVYPSAGVSSDQAAGGIDMATNTFRDLPVPNYS
jgi:hypothetical protein